MSTPIRNLVRKAISPRVLRSPRTPQLHPLNTNTPLVSPPFHRQNNFIKCLQFAQSPQNTITVSPNSQLRRKCVFDELEIRPLNDGLKKLSETKERVLENAAGISVRVSDADFEDKEIKEDSRKLPKVDTPCRQTWLEHGVRGGRILGRGSFGTVVAALYHGKRVAAKVVRNVGDGINREANALRVQPHPNIIPVMLVCGGSRHNLILMQSTAGTIDLQRLLDTGEVVDAARAASWGVQLCAALRHCHARNLLHLDVKPRNVLMETESGQCRLADFGSSMDLDLEEQCRVPVAGTAAYTAPELFRGCQPTRAADVYSLGVTLWQFLARRVPYEHLDSSHAVVYTVVKLDARPEPTPVAAPLAYRDVYTACWSTQPEARPSLTLVQQCLHDIAFQE